MDCTACRHDNEPGSRFCARCGAALAADRECGSCRAALPQGARFCPGCGTPQRDDAGAGAPPPGPRAERRQLTAMFCDLAGSTELSQRVDPEHLREILAAYQETCVQAIRRYEGHVAQYLGDGLLVYFGFPRAHEDDAERAVRAALEIRVALAALNERRGAAGEEPLIARMGIHTGLVVVTDVGHEGRQETLALGETINVAARIEALAEPGGIAVSDATLRLVPGRFETRDLGTPALKGVAAPVRVHAVEGVASLGATFRASGDSLTPFTGRADELARLAAAWDDARTGRGAVVEVCAEAGLGKSRLVHAFRQELAGVPHFSMEMACRPYHSGSAFHPLIELLTQGLEIAERDTPEEKLARLEERLGRLPELQPEEVVPYLGVLLALPPSQRFPLQHMGPELQRERTLQALLAPMLAVAARQPLVVVCEDLHWCDPSTLELLDRLVERAPELPVLVLLTFRPSFKPPWGRAPRVKEVGLERLGREDTRAIVLAAAGAHTAWTDDVVDRIAERADGVPLFAEELARTVADAGGADDRAAPHRGPERIPSSLHDSLMARLDRSAAARQVAQLGATLGRSFDQALVEAASDLAPETLAAGLEQLVEAEILYRRGTRPDAVYTFKHTLLQDTAYESQLRRRRREQHARIARVLEEHFPQRVEAAPELAAHHCAEGGLAREAVAHHKRAGERAVSRLAYAEAVEHFARAIDVLGALPESPERHTQEIDLRLAQATPLAALRGYEDEALLASVARAEQLCEALGDGPHRIPPLLALMLYYVNRAHMPRAREYARRLLAVAEPLGLAPLCVAGYMIKGTGAMTSATVPEACADLKKALEIADGTTLQAPRAAFEIDGKAMAYCTYSMALVLSGRPESAERMVELGIRRGRELGHPRTHATVLQDCATTYHLMDEPRRTAELAGQCLEVLDGRGFHSVEVSARVLRGWARARLGEPEGRAEADEGLRLAERIGALGGMTQFHFAVAELHTLAGDFEQAFEELDKGVRLIERTGEHMGYEPQVGTLRARILFESGTGTPEEMEALLQRSIELWQRSQAPWMEIHTATLLGRVALRSGRRTEEARKRLEQLYATFEEGRALARLRQAEEVLQQLRA